MKRALYGLVVASCLLGLGCSSSEEAEGDPDDGKVTEPIHEDRDTAPPLGAPRPKLAPGEVVEDQDQ